MAKVVPLKTGVGSMPTFGLGTWTLLGEQVGSYYRELYKNFPETIKHANFASNVLSIVKQFITEYFYRYALKGNRVFWSKI